HAIPVGLAVVGLRALTMLRARGESGVSVGRRVRSAGGAPILETIGVVLVRLAEARGAVGVVSDLRRRAAADEPADRAYRAESERDPPEHDRPEAEGQHQETAGTVRVNRVHDL